MEIFYSKDIDGKLCRLDADESAHCVKVLRHRCGDEISVIDGEGALLKCRIADDSPKGVAADILERMPHWGGHPYRLHLAVCPTKNIDRYEWFVEKACEIGVDSIIPIIGEHSERKVLKVARLEKILISAAKQSLKGAVPKIGEPVTVREFIAGAGSQTAQDCIAPDGLRLIAYCFEDETHPRISIKKAIESHQEISDICIMIGPEGDFSQGEATLALSHGFIPVHLGPSRLRTETAAVTAAEAVYFHFME